MPVVADLIKIQETGEAVAVCATRAVAVAEIASGLHDPAPDGSVLRVGELAFRKSTGASAISDMPNWLPSGPLFIEHFSENTEAGVTGMGSAILAAATYASSLSGEITTNKGHAIEIRSLGGVIGIYESTDYGVDLRGLTGYRFVGVTFKALGTWTASTPVWDSATETWSNVKPLFEITDDASGNRCYHVHFEDCTFYCEHQAAALHFNNSSKCSVVGCNIFGMKAYGIWSEYKNGAFFLHRTTAQQYVWGETGYDDQAQRTAVAFDMHTADFVMMSCKANYCDIPFRKGDGWNWQMVGCHFYNGALNTVTDPDAIYCMVIDQPTNGVITNLYRDNSLVWVNGDNLKTGGGQTLSISEVNFVGGSALDDTDHMMIIESSVADNDLAGLTLINSRFPTASGNISLAPTGSGSFTTPLKWTFFGNSQRDGTPATGAGDQLLNIGGYFIGNPDGDWHLGADDLTKLRFNRANRRWEVGDGYEQAFISGFDARADFVTWNTARVSAGWDLPDGTQVFVGGLAYQFSAGATDISDLGDWVPSGRIHVDHFATITSADCASAWEEAMDYLDSLGGGELWLREGQSYYTTAITHASNVTVRLNNGTLAVHSSMGKTGRWYVSRDVNLVDETRTTRNMRIIGPGTMDGSARPFDRWLSQADGTPVTDPEADYVMGTGALASGISGVNLTAVLTGDEVTSVTIVNGGSGWNGHATYPYVPSTVPLKFSGGSGSGARGYATISGGTITSVTIEQGGSGYVSAPTVETMGGYADIDLLVDPSVDRRNAGYSAAGDAVYFAKVNNPAIENVRFTGFRCRVVSDAGCYRMTIKGCEFDECAKNDGPFHCIWTQSYGTPGGGQAFYAPSERILIEDCSARDCERSAVLFGPTKGGTIRNLTAVGCGESTIYIPDKLNHDGGNALIEGCDLSDGYLTDIVGNLIEHGDVENLTVKDCRLTGSSVVSVVATGNRNVVYERNTFKNNYTALTSTGDKRFPYGPFSERYGFNSGTRPIAGGEIHVPSGSVVSIGSIGSVGGKGVRFINNAFEDDRTEYPSHIFRQSKAGSDNIAEDLTIEGNDLLSVPSGMELLDTTTGNVWDSTIPLHIRRNLGHASEAPVIVSHQISGTGVFSISPGFRPSVVEVVASTNNTAQLRSAHGLFSWTRDGVRNDFSHYWSAAEDAAAERASIIGTEVLRIVNPTSGATTLSVEFNVWTELGFSLNCVSYTDLTNIRFVCYP